MAQPIVLPASLISDIRFDRPPDIDESRTWLGVVETDGMHHLERVALEWIEEPRSEGYRMRTSVDQPLLLVTGVPNLRTGPVTTIGQWVPLSREHPVEFDFGSAQYRIRLAATRPDLCDAVVTIETSRRMQVLFDLLREESELCDEPHFEVYWAGDLDGDGALDLLVTFSPKYSMFPSQLFLSSAAEPGELVREVARADRHAE